MLLAFDLYVDERRRAGSALPVAAFSGASIVDIIALFKTLGFLGDLVGSGRVMRRNPAMAVATAMVIVHEVSVVPDVVGAGPQYQDE